MSLFPMISGQARVRLVQAGAGFLAAALVAGCGAGYRPVVTPINPSGPAQQPSALAVVVSSPSPTSPGIATIIDYAGDTVMALAPIGPGPLAFTVDGTGSNGYTLNSDGTLTNFPISSQLQEKNVVYSTLPTNSQPYGLFSPSAGLWAADLNGNIVDVLTGAPETFSLAIPVAPTPISCRGSFKSPASTTTRSARTVPRPRRRTCIPYGVACNTAPSSVTQNGEADAMEIASYTVSARIPLGKCPVYGVASSDGKRLFILNRGSDTISVINTQDNTLDQCTPFTNQNGQTVTCHPHCRYRSRRPLCRARVDPTSCAEQPADLATTAHRRARCTRNTTRQRANWWWRTMTAARSA